MKRSAGLTVTMVGAGLVVNAAAADARSVTPAPSVQAVPTLHEKYRPKYHFTPAKNWMNDPNGLVYWKGEYHLFFQYNPKSAKWGHMSWGHAVSRDLVHWKQLPLAIPEDRKWMIFSGSAVMDVHNTSGLGRPGHPVMIAVYTMASQDGKRQAQGIAYSLDDGRTFTKYRGNPVLDIGAKDFRDPKVQWYAPTKRWLMTVSNSTDHTVSFYTSKNLKKWTLQSKFGPRGATGGVWECPDLFPLNVDGNPKHRKWVLVVNLNPGAVAGGSGAQYFIGSFDGKRFTADPATGGAVRGTNWLDFGAEYYAAVSWNGLPAKNRTMIGWMNNWTYGQDTPTRPWRSQSSVPRRMALRTVNGHVRLVQTPVSLRSLVTGRKTLSDLPVSGTRTLPVRGGSYEMKVTFKAGKATDYGVDVRTGKGQYTRIGYDATTHQVYVDRRHAGASAWSKDARTGRNTFATVQRAPYVPADGKVTLRILVDQSSVEVFAGQGETVISDAIFPAPSSQGVNAFSTGGRSTISSMTVSQLRSYR